MKLYHLLILVIIAYLFVKTGLIDLEIHNRIEAGRAAQMEVSQ